MFEVIPRLYLGDAHDARDVDGIIDKDIYCVVNCTRIDVGFAEALPKNIARVRLPVDDDENRDHDFDLFIALPYAVNRIWVHICLGHGVLVHCAMGRQRSACTVAAYLIWKHGMTVEEAIKFVRSKKRDAFFPHVNFIRTLQLWYARCHRQPVPDFADRDHPRTYLVR